MNRALIIVAHGSSVKPSCAHTVIDTTAVLASNADVRARFDEVRTRFLKQPPLLADEPWDADETVVIPFFMADGYFVREVLPRDIPAGVHVTPPLGAADLRSVVASAVARIDAGAHLVLVGHGTERDPASADTVERLARRLRGELRSVTTAFVDQEPRLETTWARVPADGAPVVVIPYFAFAGPHTEVEIPAGLGLQGAHGGPGPCHIAGHEVHYAAPVGALPEIADVLVELALRHSK